MLLVTAPNHCQLMKLVVYPKALFLAYPLMNLPSIQQSMSLWFGLEGVAQYQGYASAGKMILIILRSMKLIVFHENDYCLKACVCTRYCSPRNTCEISHAVVINLKAIPCMRSREIFLRKDFNLPCIRYLNSNKQLLD